MTRKILGPFNRVEGDLEIEVDIKEGKVTKAWVNSPLYRGFEQILQGKDPRDALVYTPRICGICSVSQSLASASAIADAQGLEPALNGQLASNIILACENLSDHLTHFYLYFMPDFARDDYKNQAWHSTIGQRFRAQTGSAAPMMLKARAEFMHITGILAGKWPHSLAIQSGGTTRSIEVQDKVRLHAIINGFRQFLEQICFADSLENINQIDCIDGLKAWAESHPQADFAQFLMISEALNLQNLGKIDTHLMSYGAYSIDNKPLFKQGVWTGELQSLNTEDIAEDISHSWMLSQNGAKHPYQGTTLPDGEQSDGYSWCKAPRLAGNVMEVGALARQAVDGNPLIRALLKESGSNVQNRIIARLLELAKLVPEMEAMCQQLTPKAVFCHNQPIPKEAEGYGLVEAARGSLGHWLRIRNGRILNYQIIAPTTWNFSPRDSEDISGALEQALIGTEVDDSGKKAVAIQHVVRSFDPCMVCTVH